jgi:hypothetical protein
MTWRSRTVLLKAGPGRWLVKDRTVREGHPEGDLAVVELTRDGFVVMVWTASWCGVADVRSLPEARSVVATAMSQRANTPR